MNNTLLPSPYPVNALHAGIRDAVLEVQANLQAPDALIAGSFLTAMSIVCQSDVEVELPTGQVRPVCLNILTIADSGERKTTTDTVVCAPIYDHDARQASVFADAMDAYAVDVRCWNAADAIIQRKITKTAKNHQGYDELRAELLEHSKREPRRPRRHRILHQSITERPLMEALEGEGKSLAILSDEGDLVLKGGAMNKLSVLNKAWDGARVITLDRADDSVEVKNPRVTVSLMVQEQVFRDFIEKRGRMIRSSGHLARYLVAYPTSTQGFRAMSLQSPVWNSLDSFHARVSELLDQAASRRNSGTLDRKLLQFSPEAKEFWVQTLNGVESELQPSGSLAGIRDFASKALEIAGRVAAIFHRFTGQEGAISLDTLQRATAIVHWHLEEFKRLFGESNDIPEYLMDVRRLGMYLHSRYWRNSLTIAPRNEVRKRGPIRHQGRFEAALNQLCVEGSVCVPYQGRGKKLIHLNPQVFEHLRSN